MQFLCCISVLIVSLMGTMSMDVSPNEIFNSKIQNLKRIDLRVLPLYNLSVLFHFGCTMLQNLKENTE